MIATVIGKIIYRLNYRTSTVRLMQAVASLRKGELSNVDMLTYESDDEFGDTITNAEGSYEYSFRLCPRDFTGG